MSVATLVRLDALIKQLHLASRGMLSRMWDVTLNDNKYYIDTLDRIFIEVQTKMSKNEEKECENFQQKILNIKKQWREDISKPVRNGRMNKNYINAWSQIMNVGRSYEIFLMKTMEKHDMLLKEKGRVEDNL
jgi:hypothetical protein